MIRTQVSQTSRLDDNWTRHEQESVMETAVWVGFPSKCNSRQPWLVKKIRKILFESKSGNTVSVWEKS